MAKLGTPTKDENGRLVQRWYPVEGDTRPEGLEYRMSAQYAFLPSKGVGRPVSIGEMANEYRIPSTYIPPSGWYCVADDETVMEGDRYSHNEYDGKPHDHPLAISISHVGCNVGVFRKSYLCGWVLRRDDDKWELYTPKVGEYYAAGTQIRRRGGCGEWTDWCGRVCDPRNEENEYRRPKEQPCKSSDSAECATASAKSTTDIESGECGSAEQTPAQPATAPVAWQFVRRPMERVVDHYRLLTHLKDTINKTDEILLDDDTVGERHTYRKAVVHRVGATFDETEDNVHRRPVYAPLPTRIEDVPDGRVIEQHQLLRWRHDGAWYTQTPANYISSDQPSRFESFTITEYVAELRPVE